VNVLKNSLMKKVVIITTTIFVAIASLLVGCKKTDPTGGSNTGGSTHPYGIGNGMYSVYIKTDLGVGNITCTIDGTSVGTISHFGANTVCGSADINKVLSAGTHSFSGVSSTGVTWSFTFTVTADICSSTYLIYTGGSSGSGSSGSGGGGGSSTGQAVFYATGNFSGGPITVNVNGQSNSFNSYFTAAPSCGASGAATFTLPVGTYNFTASNTNDNWSGTINVSSGGCSKMGLKPGSGGSGGGGGSSSGELMVYTLVNHGNGPITVIVSGTYSGSVTSYYGSAPSCGASGCANFTLAPGSYNVSASDAGSTWNGTAVVTAGGCYKLSLN
jgi:major membrane immunogen (membrane-anchored lipoprotein)